jgi:cell division septal protein FtsQ
VKRRKRKEEERKKYGERKEKKVRGKRGKITYLIFLEIVIHNLYLLYYYRVMKIEDVSYKQI